jgi:hypothetical protein
MMMMKNEDEIYDEDGKRKPKDKTRLDRVNEMRMQM